MLTDYFNYKIKIRDIEYISPEGQKYSNTAKISFLDNNRKELDYIELGYIDTEDIYRKIDNNEPVDLSYCYVENFSLSIYKKSRSIEKDKYVKIKDFNAVNTFFDSQITNDFSHADFGDCDVNFEKARFLNGNVTFHASKFGMGIFDFSYVIIDRGSFDFSNVISGDGDCIFKNSIFKTGIKNFQDVKFGKGEVSFVNTEFRDGEASFVNADFSEGNVTFKVARFGDGKIDFHFAKFGVGDISFERTEFGNGKVDFRKVEFNIGRINFNRSAFGDCDVSFEGCELPKGRMTFKKTVFGNGHLNFELAEFEKADLVFEKVDFPMGTVSFYSSKFDTLIMKSCHLDNYVDMRLKKCNYLDLSEAIVRDIIDITCYDFDVNIQIMNISGMRLIGKIYIDWKKNNVPELINRQKETSLRAKSEQFRILKQNFNCTGQYDDEDSAYVQFKRNEEKAILKEAVQKYKYTYLWQYPFYLFKKLVFDKVGLYATSPFRVLKSVIYVYLIFTLIYIVAPLISDAQVLSPDEPGTFLNTILSTCYYSAITFFTVGYGEFLPTGILRFFAAIEGFFGVFMMSYFTVAFARKILR